MLVGCGYVWDSVQLCKFAFAKQVKYSGVVYIRGHHPRIMWVPNFTLRVPPVVQLCKTAQFFAGFFLILMITGFGSSFEEKVGPKLHSQGTPGYGKKNLSLPSIKGQMFGCGLCPGYAFSLTVLSFFLLSFFVGFPRTDIGE